MDEISEDDVATVARAICVAHGWNPEEIVGDNHGHDVPRWLLMRMPARSHIAAFKACAVLYGIREQRVQEAE